MIGSDRHHQLQSIFRSFGCQFTLAGRPEWIHRQPRRYQSKWRGKEGASDDPSWQWWTARTNRGSLPGRQGSSSCRRSPHPSWKYFGRGRSSTWTPSCCQDVYFQKKGKIDEVFDCQCLSSRLACNGKSHYKDNSPDDSAEKGVEAKIFRFEHLEESGFGDWIVWINLSLFLKLPRNLILLQSIIRHTTMKRVKSPQICQQHV